MRDRHGLIDPDSISEMTGKTPAELHRLEAAGRFPTRKHTRDGIGWQRRDIDKWRKKHGGAS